MLHHVRTSILLLPNPGGKLQSARGEVDWQLKTEWGREVSIKEEVGLLVWYTARENTKQYLIAWLTTDFVDKLAKFCKEESLPLGNKEELYSKLKEALPDLLDRAVACYIG